MVDLTLIQFQEVKDGNRTKKDITQLTGHVTEKGSKFIPNMQDKIRDDTIELHASLSTQNSCTTRNRYNHDGTTKSPAQQKTKSAPAHQCNLNSNYLFVYLKNMLIPPKSK